ncbi:MAG: SDR family NAD(P)-dependent oxidoreductase [Acidimicrobiales bacterium]
MDLVAGKTAVVTGAASGIGLALAERFARDGLALVLADVDQGALDAAGERVASKGVEVLTVRTDVSDQAAVAALAEASVTRFGQVHLVCNNAGVSSRADPWLGPLSAWEWVLGVNLWGVVHGVRAFLPILAAQGDGHIVNTASIAGLVPGFGPAYDASKHAVVALSEDLYTTLKTAGLPVGVSVLCPGWVRTGILDSERNWPDSLGAVPDEAPAAAVTRPHVRRAIDEGMTPAEVADRVAEAVTKEKFWVFPNPEFLEIAVRRWQDIAEGLDPVLGRDTPGLPPAEELLAEVRASLQQP